MFAVTTASAIALLLHASHLAGLESMSGRRAESPPDASEVDSQVDSDHDGIPNTIEIASNTDPLRADTDEDGVLDGDEDLDRDGRVDFGESNPRLPGLFPGSSPHIPEPLAFDLVRGLGAYRGEFEMNNLALIDMTSGETKWAPEVEWAVADGVAVELEVPIRNTEVEAVKVAGQWTAPALQRSPRTLHGIQTFVEVSTSDATPSATAVYIVGARVSSCFSFLGMLGGHGSVPRRNAAGSSAVVVNGSTFLDLGERATIGLETNLVTSSDVSTTRRRGWATPEAALRLLPQFHLQIGRRVRLQLGVGVEGTLKGMAPLAGLRVIVE